MHSKRTWILFYHIPVILRGSQCITICCRSTSRIHECSFCGHRPSGCGMPRRLCPIHGYQSVFWKGIRSWNTKQTHQRAKFHITIHFNRFYTWTFPDPLCFKWSQECKRFPFHISPESLQVTQVRLLCSLGDGGKTKNFGVSVQYF